MPFAVPMVWQEALLGETLEKTSETDQVKEMLFTIP
jgi:hypothetical protein